MNKLVGGQKISEEIARYKFSMLENFLTQEMFQSYV